VQLHPYSSSHETKRKTRARKFDLTIKKAQIEKWDCSMRDAWNQNRNKSAALDGSHSEEKYFEWLYKKATE
jgi:hypothetical protein